MLFNENWFFFVFSNFLYFSQSNDAIIYGDFDACFLQRKTNNIGVLEPSTDHNRCWDSNNDWIIIWYDGTDLCAVRNAWILTAKYPIEKSIKRHRHSSSSIVTCSWSFSIGSFPAGLAVRWLLQNHPWTDTGKSIARSICTTFWCLIMYSLKYRNKRKNKTKKKWAHLRAGVRYFQI